MAGTGAERAPRVMVSGEGMMTGGILRTWKRIPAVFPWTMMRICSILPMMIISGRSSRTKRTIEKILTSSFF